MEGVDIISSLPDEILQHILSSLWTKLAITTSVLSKRWRLVWCGTPFVKVQVKTPKLIETLTYYRPRAPKATTFCIDLSPLQNTPHVDSLIESAILHNVEKLELIFGTAYRTYTFPDVFYLSSSFKQLSVSTHDRMIPRCTVAWKSLEKLSLSFVKLSDESFANILSGCPKLESLILRYCCLIQYLDLSKSMSLKRLEVVVSRNYFPGPTEIVAPHIHYLRLTNSRRPCALVNVSSLIEAYLDIDSGSEKNDFLQTMVLNMLAKMQNLEKLTLSRTVLQILSFAELRSVPFPRLKVSTLIVETKILRYVIPGIARLLQNSPGLKKLVVVHTTNDKYSIPVPFS